MMSDPSHYNREFLPDGSYPLIQFKESDVISTALCFFNVYLSNSNHIHLAETL